MQNRFYADCIRAHPDRLGAFATVHPAMGPDGVQAEMRQARDAGLAGLGELSPHALGWALDDPALGAALGLAGEFGWPVTLHAANPTGRPYPGRVDTPLDDFLILATGFPGTRFVLAHWGGLLPLRQPKASLPPNILYDTAASPLEHGPEIWGAVIGAVGAERVIFGSDFPLNLYPGLDPVPNLARFAAEARGAVEPRMLAGVMGDNLRRLLPAAG